MFTSIDKAVVAAFGALAYLGKVFFDIDLGMSNEAFAGLVSVLVPVLVFFVPNKPWTQAPGG